MCDSIFTFSETGGYYFQCFSSGCYADRPEELVSFCETGVVKDISFIAFGGSNVFVMVYEDWRSPGAPSISSNGITTTSLEPLRSFLYEIDPESGKSLGINSDLDLSNFHVTFGPKAESFWASDGRSSTSVDIPVALHDLLDDIFSARDWPRLVSLGASGDYVVITRNDNYAARLEQYPELASSLEEGMDLWKGMSWVQNVVLNPYCHDSWVLHATSSNVLALNLPPHAEQHMTHLKQCIKQDTEALAALEAREEHLWALRAMAQAPFAAGQNLLFQEQWGRFHKGNLETLRDGNELMDMAINNSRIR